LARNFPVFHKNDGSGYEYYVRYIKKIDPINPQIAARLSKVFTLMTLVDPATQKTIKKAILPLVDDPDISSAVKEIITKVLS
jgi:aminopeptidase N